MKNGQFGWKIQTPKWDEDALRVDLLLPPFRVIHRQNTLLIAHSVPIILYTPSAPSGNASYMRTRWFAVARRRISYVRVGVSSRPLVFRTSFEIFFTSLQNLSFTIPKSKSWSITLALNPFNLTFSPRLTGSRLLSQASTDSPRIPTRNCIGPEIRIGCRALTKYVCAYTSR